MAVDAGAPRLEKKPATDDVAAGLDALDMPVVREAGRWSPRAVASRVVPPIIAVVVLIGVWQLAYVLDLKPSYALPSPERTFAKLVDLVTDGRAWTGISTSVGRGFIGFAMSLVAGTLLGLAMWQFNWLRRAIGPAVSGLMSLPSVAWVPAAIIWFQLTDATIYAVVLLGAVPSIANGLLAGFDQVPPLYSRVGRVLGLSPWGRVRHVMLPAALPGYLAGIKQGWAFAWRSLMAAELITYSPALGIGLGQLLNQGRELQQMTLVITSITLIFVVGVAIELLLFAPIERAVLRRRGLTGAR